VKHRDLIRELQELGWWQLQNSGPHEKWTNGQDCKAVPRHKEINEFTAKSILRFAQLNRAKGITK